jgi:hypothetical protein
MNAKEFDEIMLQLPCACCGCMVEPTYVAGVAVFQGGVLLQKVPAALNDTPGWAVLKHTLCTSCLEKLQALIGDEPKSPGWRLAQNLEEALEGLRLLHGGPRGPFYICGGQYEDYDMPNQPAHFGVANNPDNKHNPGRPYVAQGRDAADKLFHSCRHHAHLYQLSADRRVATLVHRGDDERVGSPEVVSVPSLWRGLIFAVINDLDFAGEW